MQPTENIVASLKRPARVCSRIIQAVMLAVVLQLTAQVAYAIPLADYHKNIQSAIAALDSLNQRDEEETDTAYDKRVLDTIDAIRASIPENQSVQLNKDAWTLDNSWLHRELKDLEKASPLARPEMITHTIERLEAVGERVAEMERPGRTAPSKNEAADRLAGILRRSEFAGRSNQESAIAKLWRDLWRWLESFLPKPATVSPGKASLLSQIILVLVVLLAIGAIAYVLTMVVPRLARLRKKRTKDERRTRIVLGEHLEPDQSAVDLLSEAEALARTGDLRAAIRKGYIALLVELGDRKIISLAQHKTNRDYLRSVSTVSSLYPSMSRLTDSFERHWYGLSPATPNDWQDFQVGYHAALQTRN